MKFLILLSVFVLNSGVVRSVADEEDARNVTAEQTTESPFMADMVLAGDAVKIKNQKGDENENEGIKQFPGNSQPHTVADFIIQPLIALKPRMPGNENVKQVAGSAPTVFPWQLFGFNGGQGLGSSVSSLADTVTGWLGNRIQLPNLVETPVRESGTTSSTTTTARPDVVVRIQQQRPATRKPFVYITNKDQRPYRRFNRPNRYNVVNYVDDSEENDDSLEYNDYENLVVNRKNHRRYHDYEENDYNEADGNNENYELSEENEEDGDSQSQEREEEDESNENPFKKIQKNPKRQLQNRNSYNLRGQLKRHQQILPQDESAEEDQLEDEDEYSYFDANQQAKRSQNELNFLQRGQQQLLKRIRFFTRGQTPAEGDNTLNKIEKPVQPVLLIKRNGQTFYVEPELLQAPQIGSNKVTESTKKPSSTRYTQLALPLRKKGQPTQYITIPWSQISISNPNRLTPSTNRVHNAKPLILTIPQDALEKIQNFNKQKKTPNLTAGVVPLPAEASSMDAFKPSRIPPARIPAKKATVTLPNRPKIAAARIHPAAIKEKVPPSHEIHKDQDQDNSSEDEDPSTQFLVVGDETVNPKFSRSAYRQILDYFNQNRSGRLLADQEASALPQAADTQEQLLPVQALNETEESIHNELKTSTESPLVVAVPQTEHESLEKNTTKLAVPKTE